MNVKYAKESLIWGFDLDAAPYLSDRIPKNRPPTKTPTKYMDCARPGMLDLEQTKSN